MKRTVILLLSLVALTHFKGHTQGGFGGANKNIGIGQDYGDDSWWPVFSKKNQV